MISSKLLCKNKFDFLELVIFTFRMSSIGFMKKDKKNSLFCGSIHCPIATKITIFIVIIANTY